MEAENEEVALPSSESEPDSDWILFPLLDAKVTYVFWYVQYI